ncbi:hypothetical protein [Mesorhizobium sp. M6A.T.Cr.TU.016.01.1.1]|uniref:hypothetical protein n=1 Tax=Mesorhizobium sp. M6A.T.Cr.TU.016.01.1.1 TaxID=2493677 RepID=UPI000F7616F2|nr:hypothetical protein [Mesorhizobium sp. M6A.T.Cr.TU.016.01.1.1]AZO67662.1 hypothetical protein EJ075_23900 [Mesorhizobium sp. M6A.T.Cr.TU.016.01.1.1]
MHKTRFLMSALAVVALAFSVCSAPAFEFERVTVTAASVEHQPAAIAVPADLAIVSATEDSSRTRASGAESTASVYFAVYSTTAPAIGRHRTFAVPWEV